jgi:drug/metabolite transporter (DMT)-like permease
MKAQALNWKIFFLIFLTDLADSVAQFFMKLGLSQTGIDVLHFSNLSEFIVRSFFSPLLWLGIFFYALTFLIWILVLCHVELSVALPVGSTSYILVPIMAMLFLNETVTPLRWGGIFMIVAGIHLVAKSSQPKALPPPGMP